MESPLKQFGIGVRAARTKKNLNATVFARGVCGSSNLLSIEIGKRWPSKALLDALVKKHPEISQIPEFATVYDNARRTRGGGKMDARRETFGYTSPEKARAERIHAKYKKTTKPAKKLAKVTTKKPVSEPPKKVVKNVEPNPSLALVKALVQAKACDRIVDFIVKSTSAGNIEALLADLKQASTTLHICKNLGLSLEQVREVLA